MARQLTSFGSGGAMIIRRLSENNGILVLGDVVMFLVGDETDGVGIMSTDIPEDATPPTISWKHNRINDIVYVDFVKEFSPFFQLGSSQDARSDRQFECGLSIKGEVPANSTRVVFIYYGPRADNDNKRIVYAGCGSIAKTGSLSTGYLKNNENEIVINIAPPPAEFSFSIANMITATNGSTIMDTYTSKIGSLAVTTNTITIPPDRTCYYDLVSTSNSNVE